MQEARANLSLVGCQLASGHVALPEGRASAPASVNSSALCLARPCYRWMSSELLPMQPGRSQVIGPSLRLSARFFGPLTVINPRLDLQTVRLLMHR